MQMRLIDLLNLIDEYGDEMSPELIQICSEDSWDVYDTFHVSSVLLKPFYNLKIFSVTAVEKNVFRVDLDFSGMEEGDNTCM